jgi:fatty acid desaturase
VLHGAVVRSPRLRLAIGWLCFLPFTLSPRLWIAWHNRVHHGNTMKHGVDPDAFPTLEEFRGSALLRVTDALSMARGRWAGFLTLLIGFTVQSQHVMWRLSRRQDYLSARERKLAVVEQLLGMAVWAAVAWAVGAHGFVLAFVVPLGIGNAVVMGYIMTNHSLSPQTEVNDPLLNSLTVTAPRALEVLHLHFGLHVEHHLFPAMSSAFAPRVREAILARWPERYQSMPLWRALGLLWSTPRIYKDATTLIEPYRGRQYSTLLPGTGAVGPLAEEPAPAPLFALLD